MAKFRLINTKFWDDTYIAELSPSEKLLYLYFISNPLTTVAGIYEITLKRIQFDTGLKSETLKKIINKFHKNKKVFFEKGWIFIVNFAKNQRANESMKIGIERELACVPPLIKAKFDTLSDGVDTLSDGGVYRDLNLNLNGDPNSNGDGERKTGFSPPSLKEIETYFVEKKSNSIEASKFFNFYESNGWRVGKNKMKKWKAAVAGWIARDKKSDNDEWKDHKFGRIH